VTSTPPFRPAWLVPLLLAAAFAGVAAFSTARAPETYPVADTATTSLSTLRAIRGDLAVGSYSRFGWNHPGPLLYQALAVPYAAGGRREIALKWAALGLNALWLAGLLLVAGRRSPALAMAIALALTPLLWREQRLLFSAWNPFVPVLALACAVAAAADLAGGAGWRTRGVPALLVVALSFCVQAHAGLAVPAAVCALAALAGLRRDASRVGLGVAIAVGLAVWAMPLVAELRDRPGNLASMTAFLLDGRLPRGTWGRALSAAAYMTLGPVNPSWIVLYDEVPCVVPAWLPPAFIALVAALGACATLAWRAGRRFEAAFAAIAAAVSLAVVVAARGVVGPLSDYLLLWAPGIGALDLAVVLAAVLPATLRARLGARRSPAVLAVLVVTTWLVIGGARLVAKHAEQARDTTVRALATDLQAYCRARGLVRPILAFGGDTAWQELAGIVLQFDKADQPIAVDDAALYLVGRPFARTGREDATFYLMPTTGATLPADAGRTEWVTTRGAYRIVRLRVTAPG
jgi:hypothetical protein